MFQQQQLDLERAQVLINNMNTTQRLFPTNQDHQNFFTTPSFTPLISPQISPPGNTIRNSTPRLAPNGSYVGGSGQITLCPDGTYVAGQCQLTPNGHYVGE